MAAGRPSAPGSCHEASVSCRMGAAPTRPQTAEGACSSTADSQHHLGDRCPYGRQTQQGDSISQPGSGAGCLILTRPALTLTSRTAERLELNLRHRPHAADGVKGLSHGGLPVACAQQGADPAEGGDVPKPALGLWADVLPLLLRQPIQGLQGIASELFQRINPKQYKDTMAFVAKTEAES